jgi:carnitine 3-dehydrogenase
MKDKLAFVGCGLIGAGLAANSLLTGHPTALYDTCDTAIIKERITAILNTFVTHGAYTQEQADEAAALATYTQDLAEAVRGAVFVQESAPERVDMKRELYRTIQETCGRDVVIGSSASNIMTATLAEGALYPDRIVVGHPFNPSHLLPTVEIVVGKDTSQETVDFAKRIYTEMDKVAVVCLKDEVGYLVQRINSQILETAILLVNEGYASAEDVDKAIMYGPGMRLPLCGQLLSIGLGVKGGWRALAQKYCGTEAPKEYLVVADGVDEEIAHRLPETGNEWEDIIRYRDKALIELQRIQGRL